MDRNSNTVAGTVGMEKDSELDRAQSLHISASTTVTRDIGDDTRDLVFPDGGFESWLQVVGGVLVTMNTWFGYTGVSEYLVHVLMCNKGTGQHVGYLSNLLLIANTPTGFRQRYILDWVNTSIPPIVRWGIVWSALRSRLFKAYVVVWRSHHSSSLASHITLWGIRVGQW